MTDEAKALLAQVFHGDRDQGIYGKRGCLHLDSGLWDCKVRASDAARTEAGARLLRCAAYGLDHSDGCPAEPTDADLAR